MKLSNPMAPEVRIAIIRADNGRCIAPRIRCDRHHECRTGVWPGPCRDLYGAEITPDSAQYLASLTIDHVQDQEGVKKGMSVAGSHRGKRAPSDPAHGATVCRGHTEDGMRAGACWNLAHRPEMRSWLATHR